MATSLISQQEQQEQQLTINATSTTLMIAPMTLAATAAASAATTATPTLRIAVMTMFTNAGETTRALEIAKALRQQAITSKTMLEIKFFATLYSKTDPTISYEHLIRQEGFAVEYIGDGVTRDEWRTILEREHDGQEYCASKDDVEEMTELFLDVKQALFQYQPTLVVHGFSNNCDAAVASQLAGIPNVLFLPIPLERDFMKNYIITDLPDDKKVGPLRLLPRSLRATLARSVGTRPSLPTFLGQPGLRQAAIAAGWQQRGTGLLGDLNSSEYLVLINDLESNYKGLDVPANTLVTGPIFSTSSNTQQCQKGAIDPEILRVFNRSNNNKPNVFVSMGSSGHKEQLLEAIRAVAAGDYNVVAVIPHSICSLEDMMKDVGDVPSNVYLTDQFVPAQVVNGMADIAIIHGGQGTVQTAMRSGTPVVGLAFQFEQAYNLQNAVERPGAGLRIEARRWKARTIRKAVNKVLKEPSYRAAARAAQKEMRENNGSQVSANKILEFVNKIDKP